MGYILSKRFGSVEEGTYHVEYVASEGMTDDRQKATVFNNYTEADFAAREIGDHLSFQIEPVDLDA